MKKYFFIVLFAVSFLPGNLFAQGVIGEFDQVDPVPYSDEMGEGNEFLPSRDIRTFTPFQTVTQNSPAYDRCFSNLDDLGDLLCRIGELINYTIPILLGLGVLYFVWGVVQYFIGSDEEAKTRGKDRIIYGIIGLTIIVSVWGLVAIVIKTFGIEGSAPNVNLLNFRVDPASQPGDSALFCSLNDNPKLQHLLGYATCIITKSVVPLIFAVALAAFVWGVVQYVILSDSDEKRSQGRQFMLWGIIALTVMITVWGLVSIVAKTFNVDNVIPQVKGR